MRKHFYKSMLMGLILLTAINISAQQVWLQLPDYPGAGSMAPSSVTLNGKGYMGLGLTPGPGVAHATDWWEYNPVTGNWTQKANFPGTASGFKVDFVINDKIYVITGQTNGGTTGQNYMYDPASNTWTPKANFPAQGRMNAAGFAINGKGYVGTGFIGSNTALTDWWEYDPIADSWTQKANYPGTGTSGAFSFVVNGKGYVGMGNTGNTVYYNEFYEYDPSNNTWAQKADFPLPYLSKSTNYSSNTYGYVLCGFYYQFTGITYNPLNTLYRYSPANDEWVLRGTFWGLPRGYAGGFGINDDMYIAAGNKSNVLDADYMLHDFWKLADILDTLDNTHLVSGIDNGNKAKMHLLTMPNPASNEIYFVSTGEAIQVKKVRIYNNNGQLVKDITINGNLPAVDIRDLANGVYFTEIITQKDEVIDSKFVKQ